MQVNNYIQINNLKISTEALKTTLFLTLNKSLSYEKNYIITIVSLWMQ
jgi:hypothetical protein